jgi:hypothetical protein
MRGFLIVMHERDDVDFGMRRDVLEQVIRANAIAPIWRVRQAVREEQDPHAREALTS